MAVRVRLEVDLQLLGFFRLVGKGRSQWYSQDLGPRQVESKERQLEGDDMGASDQAKGWIRLQAQYSLLASERAVPRDVHWLKHPPTLTSLSDSPTVWFNSNACAPYMSGHRYNIMDARCILIAAVKKHLLPSPQRYIQMMEETFDVHPLHKFYSLTSKLG